MRWFAVIILALAAQGCADDATSEPFTSGEDLTEWVTAEEMNEVLERIQTDFTGSPLDDEVVTEPDDDSFWYRYGVPEGSEGEAFEGGWEVVLQPWPDGDAMAGAQTFPSLPDGVEAAGPSYGGVYFLRGPRSAEILSLWVDPPDPSYVGVGEADEARWQDVYFQVASMALREMGWAE